jgi:hypothetical protein
MDRGKKINKTKQKAHQKKKKPPPTLPLAEGWLKRPGPQCKKQALRQLTIRKVNPLSWVGYTVFFPRKFGAISPFSQRSSHRRELRGAFISKFTHLFSIFSRVWRSSSPLVETRQSTGSRYQLPPISHFWHQQRTDLPSCFKTGGGVVVVAVGCG